MRKIYHLKEPSATEKAFGNIIHEIILGSKRDNSDCGFPLITWIYKWDGYKTAYSQSFKELITLNMWPN